MSSSIFVQGSGLAGLLGEYNSIKNGSYGRLMRQYYASARSSVSSGSSSASGSNILEQILEERRNPKVSEEVTNANSQLNMSVSSLKSSLKTLQSASTYEDTEKGSTATEKMTSALKSYVSSYNDAVASSKKTTMSNYSGNIAGMMKATAANAEDLKEIGITINNDGTINLDEKKLKTAEPDKVKSIFSGENAMSYGSVVESRLNRVSVTNPDSNATKTDSTYQQTKILSSSDSLISSIENILSQSLFDKTTDKDGNSIYDVDNITSETDNFIKFYNSTISNAKNSNVSGVTSNLASMMAKTAEKSYDLSKIGITIGSDGKLAMNKDTFKSADMDDVKDTLTKYASSIKSNASLLNYYSSTQYNTGTPYSSDGAYTSTSDLVSKMYNTSV